MPEWSDILKALLSVGGVSTTLAVAAAGFQSWRLVVRDNDERRDREQAAVEANERVIAMTNMATAVLELTRTTQRHTELLVRIDARIDTRAA